MSTTAVLEPPKTRRSPRRRRGWTGFQATQKHSVTGRSRNGSSVFRGPVALAVDADVDELADAGITVTDDDCVGEADGEDHSTFAPGDTVHCAVADPVEFDGVFQRAVKDRCGGELLEFRLSNGRTVRTRKEMTAMHRMEPAT